MIDVYMNDSVVRSSIWILVTLATMLMIGNIIDLYRYVRTMEEFWSEFRLRLIAYVALMIVGVLSLLLIGSHRR